MYAPSVDPNFLSPKTFFALMDADLEFRVTPDAVQMPREVFRALKAAACDHGIDWAVRPPVFVDSFLGLPVSTPEHHPLGVSWWHGGELLGFTAVDFCRV